MTLGYATYEQKCQRTHGCYLGFLHTGMCLTYSVPNVQTVYPIGYQELLNENYRLTLENTELKKDKSKEKAAHLWNEETQSYQIPLSKPGRVEWPDVEVDESEPTAYIGGKTENTAVYNVTQNRSGVPGTFSWGPQTKQDYEATEEHRRTNYGEFERKKDVVKVEMVTVFEVDADVDVWYAVETGKAVECSLRILEEV